MYMPFTQKSREHAICIMQDISQHPCSKPFIFPLDPISSKCIDYYEKIKKPISITLIINKLLNAEEAYPNIENWRADIQLLYKNAISYFGHDSQMGYLAEAFLKIFEKKYRNFSLIYNNSLWLQRYSSLLQKIKMLDLKMPGSIGNTYLSLYACAPPKPSLNTSTPKCDNFVSEFETIEKTDEMPFNSQTTLGPCQISNQSIETVDELKPKKNRPGRPRKNSLQVTVDKEKSDKPKVRRPRKPRQPKENIEKPIDNTDSKNDDLPLKLDSFDSSITDEFQSSFSTFSKTVSSDISPPSFTFGVEIPKVSIQTNDYSDKPTIINNNNQLPHSIFGIPPFEISQKISQPSAPINIGNDHQISLPSKLPAKLEEKVEDMEDDVLYEVTSCFS